jgi:hypothetical protein
VKTQPEAKPLDASETLPKKKDDEKPAAKPPTKP